MVVDLEYSVVRDRVRPEYFRRPIQAINYSELSIIERIIVNVKVIIIFLIRIVYDR